MSTYQQDQLNKLKPFKLNDLKYGISLKITSQNNNTNWMSLTSELMDELNIFFKEFQKAQNDNPEI